MELLIILLGLIIDRITKIWAINALSNEIVVIKGLFSFSYLENRGAAFGVLQNKLVFLTVITLAVLIAIMYYMIVKRPSSLWVRLSLSLIVSGAIGNMIDRIYYKYVVDFILWHYKDKYYFPTFNVADMMVVIGTILLAGYILFEDKEGK